jgi:hypothetical protein
MYSKGAVGRDTFRGMLADESPYVRMWVASQLLSEGDVEAARIVEVEAEAEGMRGFAATTVLKQWGQDNFVRRLMMVDAVALATSRAASGHDLTVANNRFGVARERHSQKIASNRSAQEALLACVRFEAIHPEGVMDALLVRYQLCRTAHMA